MGSDPTVVIVAADAERGAAAGDALGSVTSDLVSVETASEAVAALRDRDRDEHPADAVPVHVVVVAAAGGQGVIGSVETLIEADHAVPIVVYAEGLSGGTLRELLAREHVDYVPADAHGATDLLAARVRRAVLDRRDRQRRAEARERTPSMLDDVSEAVFVLNPDRHVVYCNRAAEGLFGRGREEALGRRLDTFARTDDTAFERAIQGALDRGEVVAFEAEVDGTHYDVRAYPIAAGLSVFARDVTERHERHRLFQAVFGGAMDAMLIADDDGRYVDVNAAAVELAGVGSVDDLVGRSIEEFAPPEYDVAAAWARFRTSDRDRGLFPLVRADGGRRVVEFAATPNVVEGRHLSVIRDVTGREGYPAFDAVVEDAARATGASGR
ncbi:PAS domain-containing protein [Halorubrum sp. JWXQ-INN 858]|uniref:PAS domain-containing protein n=1 Tax=Halorubrum sp. JWXQ-INN 858 TaxID=2690782 RepID=UPI00135C2677|nr:PAS domain-containing protein [Halorubrum sp. JWXQ-INN 858]MWV64429.1 PAS domain-containing protein [Halorubrum sp. JWXQ-INN 858]